MPTKPERQIDEVGDELAGLQSEIVESKTREVPIVELTRDVIARTVVQVFFLLLAVILIGIPIYNANVASDLRLNLTDLLQQYSAILGPILGFVIGYYFKTKND